MIRLGSRLSRVAPSPQARPDRDRQDHRADHPDVQRDPARPALGLSRNLGTGHPFDWRHDSILSVREISDGPSLAPMVASFIRDPPRSGKRPASANAPTG